MWILASLGRKLLGPTLDELQSAARRTWTDVDAGFDRRTAVVLTTVAVCLTFQEYTETPDDCRPAAAWLNDCGLVAVGETLSRAIDWAGGRKFTQLVWWAGATLIAYFIVPVVVTWSLLRVRVRDLGLSLRGAAVGSSIYLGMAVVMAPVVWYASSSPAFLSRYPFYRLAPGDAVGDDFLLWELLYAAQFVALEFFFRGFMLHGIKHRFGVYAIFVAMVPYCLIHFGKPMPETLAAIVAGIALGLMSLKTRSIWLGAALHITVAWSMDALALWRTGHLFR